MRRPGTDAADVANACRCGSLFRPSRGDGLEPRPALSGPEGHPAQRLGSRAGGRQRPHAGRALGAEAAALDYVSSPLVRARETMELMRTEIGLPPRGLSHRRPAARDPLRPLGGRALDRAARQGPARLRRARGGQMGLAADGRGELPRPVGARGRMAGRGRARHGGRRARRRHARAAGPQPERSSPPRSFCSTCRRTRCWWSRPGAHAGYSDAGAAPRRRPLGPSLPSWPSWPTSWRACRLRTCPRLASQISLPTSQPILLFLAAAGWASTPAANAARPIATIIERITSSSTSALPPSSAALS